MQFRSCELDNNNACDSHNADLLQWLAIETGIFGRRYYLDETHYRWYENRDNITPNTPLAGENETLLSIPANRKLRLRLLIKNAANDIPVESLSLKLQYANTLSCSSAVTWTDVGNV